MPPVVIKEHYHRHYLLSKQVQPYNVEEANSALRAGELLIRGFDDITELDKITTQEVIGNGVEREGMRYTSTTMATERVVNVYDARAALMIDYDAVQVRSFHKSDAYSRVQYEPGNVLNSTLWDGKRYTGYNWSEERSEESKHDFDHKKFLKTITKKVNPSYTDSINEVVINLYANAIKGLLCAENAELETVVQMQQEIYLRYGILIPIFNSEREVKSQGKGETRVILVKVDQKEIEEYLSTSDLEKRREVDKDIEGFSLLTDEQKLILENNIQIYLGMKLLGKEVEEWTELSKTQIRNLSSPGARKVMSLGYKYDDLKELAKDSTVFTLFSNHIVLEKQLWNHTDDLETLYQNNVLKFTAMTSKSARTALKSGVTFQELLSLYDNDHKKFAAMTSKSAIEALESGAPFQELLSLYDNDHKKFAAMTSKSAIEALDYNEYTWDKLAALEAEQITAMTSSNHTTKSHVEKIGKSASPGVSLIS